MGRVASFAAILVTALVSSGCPGLNRQPDYLGDRNAQFSVPDPLPETIPDAVDQGAANAEPGPASELENERLSDQARRAL
jgi:hypothetical protein